MSAESDLEAKIRHHVRHHIVFGASGSVLTAVCSRYCLLSAFTGMVPLLLHVACS
jgi:hypothetical protein